MTHAPHSPAAQLITALLEEVDEWHFEERHGAERNFCRECGATYPIGEPNKKHTDGCALPRLLANANAFIQASLHLPAFKPPLIFVFGSNRAGRHGKGAALYAVQHHDAIRGQGEGMQGSAYAIPTKDGDLNTLPLEEIKKHVDKFLDFASSPIGQYFHFQVTPIGTGLAGYKHEDIAYMFARAPSNCFLCDEWNRLLPERLARDMNT